MKKYDVVILGSGPAGLTAAIYTARAGLYTLVIDGTQPGGQLTITTGVENYPGFPDGIAGPQLMANIKKQAENFGAEFLNGEAEEAELSEKPVKVRVGKKIIEGKTLIIASGASARWLGLENEKKFYGKGVSACATCDGFFFKNKTVMIVGGGDTALEEAMFLTRFAKEVHVIHRRNELRAGKYMQDAAFKNEKISFIWDSVVEDILGDDNGVTGIKIRNVKTNDVADRKCDGVFMAIGHMPNTKIFKGKIDMNADGYLVTKPDRTLTNIDGVFAAGDVRDPYYRQAVTAAGSGCMAAIEAERYLASL